MKEAIKADIVIVGGGAAGFFGAIHAAQTKEYRALIIEKTTKLLSKVKVSGGGRCNVTHAAFERKKLLEGYPRGATLLTKAFEQFDVEATIHWFQSRGVKLKTEDDGRMFPVTDNSQTIVDCLQKECKRLNVQIETGMELQGVVVKNGHFELTLNTGAVQCKSLIICSGGAIKAENLHFLKSCGHGIISPVPSLFTFNLPKAGTAELMGLSVQKAKVSLPQFKQSFTGPLLFTHWGLSGPAVLKLSAFCARQLHDCAYNANVSVDFLPDNSESDLKEKLKNFAALSGKKKVLTQSPFVNVPQRLWVWLIAKTLDNPERNWAECGKKQWEAMSLQLKKCSFQMQGKTTFKEEFVTCGGIDTGEVEPETMMSKLVPGLFFAGEVLDIDGITGGYNFQAAWTTGYIAGLNAALFAKI